MGKMLQVRNVPDDVHAELKRRAQRNRQSLSDFVLTELERVVQRRPLDEILDEAARDGTEFGWEDVLRAKNEDRD
jgi:antitoxin FitA